MIPQPRTLPDALRQRFTLPALRLLAFGLACHLAARLSLELTVFRGMVPLCWAPAGVMLAAFVRWDLRVWPAAWIAILLALAMNGLPPAWSALWAGGAVAGPWLASRWLRRQDFGARLSRATDQLLLLGAAAVGGGLLSAAVAATAQALAGRIAPVDLPWAGLQCWIGEVMGVLLVGVPGLTSSRREWHRNVERSRWIGAAVLCVCTLALAAIGFGAQGSLFATLLPLLFLVPVMLGAISLRRGPALASVTLGLLALGALTAQTVGLGPFRQASADAPLHLLMAWLAVGSASVLLPHALLGEQRQLAERWRLAVEGSDLGVADWNLRTGTGFASSRWQAMLEPVTDGDVITLERWLRRVHPEDRPFLHSALAAVDGADPEAAAGLRREMRLWVRDQWRWFDLHVAVAERDARGVPLRLVASVADAGERRRAWDREQLSSSLFVNLHEGLLITDADMIVLDANPAYCGIVGLQRDSVIGTVPAPLRAASPDPLTRQQQAALWSGLRGQGHWAGEIVQRRGDGEPRTLHLTISAVRGPDGALRFHVIVVSDMTEQRRQRERLELQAHFDELTGLPNRSRLSKLLAEGMAATDRDQQLLVVCYLDIDHFKSVNDAWGHEAGDRFLRELARRMQSALRTRSGWADVAARLGGDEFVLLLRSGTLDEARAAVERMLRLVSTPYAVVPDRPEIVVSASVGATVYPLDGSDADTLLRHADHAMFGAKQAGRNGYLFFDPEHSRRTEERVMAIGRVQDALDRGELRLYYQPKVDLRRGAVVGVEALLRWHHPEQGVVPPAQFLPLIEHTGLSASIGDHVLAQALDQLDRWAQQGLDLTVSVNVSARHLQEPDFVQRLAELLARHVRPLGPRLELEILETAALADVGHTSSLLEKVSRLGVRCALDDFGTGYSTLTYLKRLPIQVLKIDRSFVRGMLEDPQDRAIVEGVISLARTFECTAVAEGVETPAQARLLLDIGCDVAQGAGIADAMPAEDVARWMQDWRGLFALAAAPAGTPRQAGAAE